MIEEKKSELVKMLGEKYWWINPTDGLEVLSENECDISLFIPVIGREMVYCTKRDRFIRGYCC